MSNKKTVLLANRWPAWRVASHLADPSRGQELIQFLRERHSEKFFEPIGSLRAAAVNKWGYGFSILALCSLMIETIQSYWEGWPSTNKFELAELSKLTTPQAYVVPKSEWPTTKSAFQDFFSNPVFKPLFPSVDANQFYECIRNGLLHQGQTKNGWKIWEVGPLWNSSRSAINRNKFADAVAGGFEAYLGVLNMAAWGDPRWVKARRKIWWLIELS